MEISTLGFGSPHPEILRAHFMSAIAFWMKTGVEPTDLEIENNDDGKEELMELVIQGQNGKDAQVE